MRASMKIKRSRAMDNSAGLTVAPTKDSGAMANKTAEGFIVTRKELKGLVSGAAARKLNGSSDLMI
jgi:hypothetical protein